MAPPGAAGEAAASTPQEDAKVVVNDYERHRLRRIAANKAKLQELEVPKPIRAVRVKQEDQRDSSCTKATKAQQNKSKRQSEPIKPTSRRASDRITARRQSSDGIEVFSKVKARKARPASVVSGRVSDVTGEMLALRCKNRDGRGGLYDQVVGICCHFCRQKKLCAEEACPRCSQLDSSKECIGKSACSRCRSANGIFCRACLRVRYGQELEAVRADPSWMCAHCIEELGTIPHWVCNRWAYGI
eukprot:jgi/Chlat1/1773/Chrsp134S00112